jgi:hypothetical protein
MQWRPAAARVTRTENYIAFHLTGTGFSEFCRLFLPVWLSLVPAAREQDVCRVCVTT